MLGFDTETYLFCPGLAAPKLVCGSWANAEQEFIGDPAESVAIFRSTLERGDHMIGVNLAYDVVVMAAHDPTLLPLIFEAGNAGLFHDCAIREALCDIARDRLFKDLATGKKWNGVSDDDMGGRYSMAVLMQRHFHTDISSEKTGDVWRYKYAQLDGVPIEQWPAAAVEYPKQDARRTYDIGKAQRGFQNLHDEPAQVRASIAIQLMRAWGFRTDGDYLAHLEKEVDALWEASRAEFSRSGIFRPDGTKDKKRLQAMVTAAYAGDPPRSGKGGVSTDRDTLLESGDPILEKLGASGKNDKRKTTYLPALRKGVTVPINPEFNVLVNTGRVSADFQQLPQKGGLREALIARPGTVLSSNDYRGLELRTMAQRAILEPGVGFSKMAEYLNTGKDTHSYVGGFFLGITLEQFLARKEELDAYRRVGKMFNFSCGGGAGAFAIAYNAKAKDGIRFCLTLNKAKVCGVRKVLGFIGGVQKRACALCVEIAKDLKEKWLQAWPEQGLLFRKASSLTAGKQKVNSVTFGSNRLRGGCGYSQWLNSPFQAAGGDGTKKAMWRIAEESYTDRRSPLWGSRVFLNVHDELLTEHPWDRRHDAAFRVAAIMVEEMNKITPDVRNEVKPAISRRSFKAATDVYDKAGVLRPWWPKVWDWPADQEIMARDLAA